MAFVADLTSMDEQCRAGVTVLILAAVFFRHASKLTLAVLLVGWTAASAGEDVPTSYVEAMEWYRVQAMAGNAEAQFLLGYGYETGTAFGYVPETQNPLPVDLAKARNWYAAASAQNHGRAQVRLARMLLEAMGGPTDPGIAHKLLVAASESGETDAMSLLGFLLLAEEPQDPVGAFRWLSVAAEAGDPVAASNLALLEEGMSEEMREHAAAELMKWRDARGR